VAELRQTTAGALQYDAKRFSNSFVFGPVVIQPDLSVSTTSSIIFWSMRGGEKGIIVQRQR
jgi:hypothetical protein